MSSELAPFSEQLVSPRADIAQGSARIVRSPLLENQHLLASASDFQSTEQRFGDVVDVGRSVAKIVRNTLWFKKRVGVEPLLTPEELAKNPATDCHGYTIVTSECLDYAQVPHLVGYANCHSFVLLYGEDQNDDTQYYLLNGHSKDINARLGIALAGDDPVSQLTETDMAANGLSTRDLLKNAGRALDQTAKDRDPWLSFGSEGSTRFMETEREIRLLERIQMRTYTPEIGRTAILNLVNLETIKRRDRPTEEEIVTAASLMQDLHGLYPEVDPRNKFKTPTWLRKQLVQRRMFKAAIDAATAFDASLVHNDRARFFLPDTLRQVGNDTRDPQMLEDALKLYQREVTLPHVSTRRGKIAKTRNMLTALK